MFCVSISSVTLSPVDDIVLLTDPHLLLHGSTEGCPGGCAISNCGGCYYSYNDLPFPPLPGSCPSVCPLINGEVDESCMSRWGQCVQRSYYTIYKTVCERFKDNFRCWPHQCIN